jgi:hypothetical protein
MKYSGEVLIYLQKVKLFFQNDDNAREYFLVETDEINFFNIVSEIAQENYDKKGDPILSIEQFESIRNQMINLDLNKNLENSDVKIISNIYKIFLNHDGYEKICLN